MRLSRVLFGVAVLGLATASSCEDEARGPAPLTIAIEGRVGNEPLVLDSETYAAGTAAEGFRPTRVSFYASDLRLVGAGGEEVALAEVAYFALGPDGEAELSVPAVPAGTYDALRFTVGLSPEQDATTPADYAPDHPLGRASEYWVDWGSYIFLKLEGLSDTLADGRERFDAAFTYHIGRSAEAAREVRLEAPLVVDGDGARLALTLDLARLLGLGTAEELPVVGVADHRNGAAERIMSRIPSALSSVR